MLLSWSYLLTLALATNLAITIVAHSTVNFCSEFITVCDNVCDKKAQNVHCLYNATAFLGYDRSCICVSDNDVTDTVTHVVVQQIDADAHENGSDISSAEVDKKPEYYVPVCRPLNITSFCSDFSTVCKVSCASIHKRVTRNSCYAAKNKVGYRAGCKCNNSGKTMEALSNLFSLVNHCVDNSTLTAASEGSTPPSDNGKTSVYPTSENACSANFEVTWNDNTVGFGLSLKVTRDAQESQPPTKYWSVDFSWPEGSNYDIQTAWNVAIQKEGRNVTVKSEDWVRKVDENGKIAGFTVVGQPAVIPTVTKVVC